MPQGPELGGPSTFVNTIYIGIQKFEFYFKIHNSHDSVI
jgi:hypothetical protein